MMHCHQRSTRHRLPSKHRYRLILPLRMCLRSLPAIPHMRITLLWVLRIRIITLLIILLLRLILRLRIIRFRLRVSIPLRILMIRVLVILLPIRSMLRVTIILLIRVLIRFGRSRGCLLVAS